MVAGGRGAILSSRCTYSKKGTYTMSTSTERGRPPYKDSPDVERARTALRRAEKALRDEADEELAHAHVDVADAWLRIHHAR